MTDQKVVALTLSVERATEILRDCADCAWRVSILDHALQRMDERSITHRQVFDCLKRGSIVDGPKRDDSGDWKCTVRWITSGVEVKVGAALDVTPGKEVTIVVTVYV